MERVGLLPAAGMAQRLGNIECKELLPFHGRPVVDHSLRLLHDVGVDRVVLVLRRGKEAILEHVVRSPLVHRLEVVWQEREIGNLVEAFRVAAPHLGGAHVMMCLPDTWMVPNPFIRQPNLLTEEADLALHCFRTATQWKHFGVVDSETGRVTNKPTEYSGSLCWGALEWGPRLTDSLATVDDLDDLLNGRRASWAETIDDYVDIGLHPGISDGVD